MVSLHCDTLNGVSSNIFSLKRNPLIIVTYFIALYRSLVTFTYVTLHYVFLLNEY